MRLTALCYIIPQIVKWVLLPRVSGAVEFLLLIQVDEKLLDNSTRYNLAVNSVLGSRQRVVELRLELPLRRRYREAARRAAYQLPGPYGPECSERARPVRLEFAGR